MTLENTDIWTVLQSNRKLGHTVNKKLQIVNNKKEK